MALVKLLLFIHDHQTAFDLSVSLPTNFQLLDLIWTDYNQRGPHNNHHCHHFKSGYLPRNSCDLASWASHWHVKLNSTHSSAFEQQPAADEYEHISEHMGLSLSPCVSSAASEEYRGRSTEWQQVHLSPAVHVTHGVGSPACCSAQRFALKFHFSTQASWHVVRWPCILVITRLQLWV